MAEPLPDIKNSQGLFGKRVFVRMDFNVPVQNGKIFDTERIERSLPTIAFLKNAGAKVILGSHIGSDGEESLRPVHEYLRGLIADIEFSEAPIDETLARATQDISEGGVLFLENLRRDPGEKSGSEEFARRLAALADIYVNEAFASSHRAHASITGIPRFLPHYAGNLFLSEVAELGRALAPEHPFTLILGGAKFETKLPLIKKFLSIADTIFVCGAPAHSFYRVRGHEIGASLIDESVSAADIVNEPKIIIPSDVIVARGPARAIVEIGRVEKTETIFDSGPASLSRIEGVVRSSKFVLWNGPLGDYEKGFLEGTDALARIIA